MANKEFHPETFDTSDAGIDEVREASVSFDNIQKLFSRPSLDKPSRRERRRFLPKGEAVIDATRALGAVIPPVSVGLESITQLFDQSEAKAVKTIGDSQIEAARKALTDAQQDPDNAHTKTAEQALRTGYELIHKEIENREGKVLSPLLPTGDTRAAYQRATEAALLIATLNQGSPTAETWTNHARDDFEQYANLTAKAAEKGIRPGKKDELREELEQERKSFEELSNRLTQPEEQIKQINL